MLLASCEASNPIRREPTHPNAQQKESNGARCLALKARLVAGASLGARQNKTIHLGRLVVAHGGEDIPVTPRKPAVVSKSAAGAGYGKGGRSGIEQHNDASCCQGLPAKEEGCF